MELCEASLDDVIKGDYKLPRVAPMVELLRQAAAGVQYLHSMKIVHRGIKPSNVLITAETEKVVAKLGGLLNAVLAIAPLTWSWTAPECSHAQTADSFTIYSDVFALGCVTGYAISRHPFGGTADQRSNNIRSGTIVRENVDALRIGALIATVGKMISNEPKERPSIDWVVKQMDQCKDWREVVSHFNKFSFISVHVRFRVSLRNRGPEKRWKRLIGSSCLSA